MDHAPCMGSLATPLLGQAASEAERPGSPQESSGTATASSQSAASAEAPAAPEGSAAAEGARAEVARAEVDEAAAGAEAAALAREAASAEQLRTATQAACSLLLLFSCFLATALILSEAAQGLHRSLYCRLGKNKKAAPLACVVPLASAAILCHVAVVAGLLCVARFAWRSGGNPGGPGGVAADVERHRVALRSDLKMWRGMSAKVLLVAGVTYLLAGAPCAGFARLAFVFLATGFLTLYATALFFDDDFEHVRMSPRFIHFLGVYTLVGLTFMTLSSGVTELLSGARTLEGVHPSEGQGDDAPAFAAVCSSGGKQRLSPASCTVPLDIAAGVSFWWAASPLFAALLPTYGSETGVRGGAVRRLLQRWRRRVDLALLLCVLGLLVALREPCQQRARVAFGNAGLGVWTLGLLAILRRYSNGACDGWRGPLEHLAPVPGPNFSMQQCAVCLMDLTRGEDICRTPCFHDFHRDCLEEWVLSRRFRSPGCPLCREPLALNEGISGTMPCLL